MNRSSVRFRQVAPMADPLLTRKAACPVLWLCQLQTSSNLVRAPQAHPRSEIEPLQARGVGAGAEEMQIDVGGCDRLMAHPGLDRAGVDTASQPEACGCMSQVVNPPPVARRIPPD